MAENILTMENIVKTYKMGDEQQTVLKGIDLQVDKGEFVAILGPSGSGKSTLMNIIGCLDTATSGTYHLHGRDVSALSESELARVRSKEIGFIFQSFQLLQRQDALQNVELPLIYAGMSGHERAARAQQMLERVGLKDKMHHFPNQLSGGSCWTRWACLTATTIILRNCPADSSSASRLPARWRTTRPSCWRTSRRVRLTGRRDGR